MKRIFLITTLATFSLIGFAQDKPDTKPESKEIIKQFPPSASVKFTDVQKEIELAKSQLDAAQAKYDAAQAKVRLALYAIADEMDLNKVERNTCRVSQNAAGLWLFTCPPAEPEPKKPDAKKSKE